MVETKRGSATGRRDKENEAIQTDYQMKGMEFQLMLYTKVIP